MTAGARWLVVAAGSLALTLAVSWPLPRCLGSCLGPSEDPLISVYFLRWVAHALVTPGVRLLDASIFAPYSATLLLGEHIPAYALVALPTIVLTGNPVLAHNVALVTAYALAALGSGVLAARLAGGAGAGIVGAVAFAYSPFLVGQAYNLQTLAVFWVPWLFLALERFVERPTWTRAALVAGAWLALALTGLNVFVFTSVAAVVWSVIAVVSGHRCVSRAHLLRLGPGALAAPVLAAAYLQPFRAVARDWRLGRTLAEVEAHSPSLRSLVGLPRGPLLYQILGLEGGAGLSTSPLLSGITLAILSALGLAAVVRDREPTRRALLAYVAMGLAALVLALGPALATPWGAIPLPYRALYEFVPGFTAIRATDRFLLLAALAMALLAAAGAACIAQPVSATRRPLLLAGLAGLLLLESLTLPFPGVAQRLDPAEVPEVYRWLATQDPRTVVLDLPMQEDWRKLGIAAFHLRPMVNGFASFNPPHYHTLARALGSFPDERSLALVGRLRPDVIVVDRVWLDPARAAALAASVADERVGLRLERTLGRHDVYRLVGPRPSGPEQLRATARVAPLAARPVWYACVILENPGPGWVPLYPLHRLRVTAERDPATVVATAVAWLPMDLAPGTSHTACVELGPRPDPVRIRGEVEGPGPVHRFVVTPEAAPAR